MVETVTVKGVGTASTKPDYVIISLSLSVSDKEYSKAVSGANEKIELLKKAITKAGYDESDLKTNNFSARTEYNYNKENKREFSGYVCEYHLHLAFDFTAEALANALNAVANSGADASFSISFTVKEPEKVNEALLISATENARKKAEILCRASGKKLGKLLNIDYNWGEIEFLSRSSYDTSYSCVSTDGIPEFTPEDIESQDSVTFVWEIV